MEDVSKRVDPRGPDGVTILAPAEQARPNDYPGVRTGAAPKDMMLFDLQNDPSEQKDVSDSHPEVVRTLKTAFDKVDAEAQRLLPMAVKPRSQGILRLKGGSLRYDQH
jgi:hypothetical protein